MKIALLNIYNGVIERGSEVFVDELASQLAKRHEITVFQTGKAKHEAYKVVQIKGIPFYSHQGPGGKLFWLGRIFYTQFFYYSLALLFTIKCIPYLWKEKYDWIIPINGR